MDMTEKELKKILHELCSRPENEVVEFKKAEFGFDSGDLGKYFSALSNEANLSGAENAWLIFGVHDKTKEISGTDYRNNLEKLQKLKHELAQKTTGNITFIEIYELSEDGKRVILFQIPPAPLGVPVAFEGHFYGRDGESLVALNLRELEQIRSQPIAKDWTAEVVPAATIQDLDEEAIFKARMEYKKKNPKKAGEMELWDNITFLNKAKITIDGRITNAALILLGKEESVQFIKPSIAQITWILRDDKGIEINYKHFTIPLLLNVDRVLNLIRNLTFREMPGNTLFPDEITPYDDYVIREALHNCIAHQDYRLQQRINVVENPDFLIFDNGGEFIPQTVERVIEQDAPQRFYKNKFLCEAMVALNMIDTIGSGIKKMFVKQKERFFPLPDYTIKEKESVTVKIYGKTIDKNYVRLLRECSDLSLFEIILLDRVQKGLKITDDAAVFLRRKKLIEGRKPNFYLSKEAIPLSDDELKKQYIKNRSFDDRHCKDLLIEYLEKWGSTPRCKLQDFIWNKLSDVLSDKQKEYKVTNLLKALKKEGRIRRTGVSSWDYNKSHS